MNENYGHWKTLKQVSLQDYLGFVYVIEFSDGTKYVGAKKIWKNIKVPPSSFKKKKGFAQSDWKTYTSSSKEVNENISKGIFPSNYVIVGFYTTWGKTLFAEAMMQIENNVLAKNHWLNKHIEGHFTFSSLDDSIETDIEAWKQYEAGLLKIEVKHTPLTLFNQSESKDVKIIDKYIYIVENKINPNTLERLLDGEIDDINGQWKLPLKLQRKNTACIYKGVSYAKIQDLLDAESIDRKSFNALVKNGSIIKPVVESRNDYINRLKGEKYER